MGLKKAPGVEILNGWKEIANSRRGGRSLARSVDALVGNLRASATGLPRRRSAVQRESSGSGGTGLNSGMGSIRWQLWPRDRHEYLWGFSSTEGTAKEVWIRAEPGWHGC